MMLVLLSHSRSGRFVSGCDQVFGCWEVRTTTELSWFCVWGGSDDSCVARAPKCRHSLGWWHEVLSELHDSSEGKARLWELSRLFRGHADGKWSVRRMCLWCVCAGKPLLCGLRVKCVTDERDDVGIVPSALFVLLPISVIGLVLTMKYHSLIADNNSVPMQLWFN